MGKNSYANYWHLLWVIAKTDFKLRYYGSALGYVWSLLKPLLMFGVLYVVFSVMMRWNIQHYQLYLLLGIIIWNFFAEATTSGLHAFLSKAGIIKKIYFPRILVVLATTVTAFISLLLNLVVFFIVYAFSGVGFDWIMLLLPIYLILTYFFALGLSLILSILQVWFRDVAQIWEIFLQVGFYISPVIYPLSLVPREYWKYMFINPITGIIQYSRLLIIDHSFPSLIGSLYLFGFIFVICVGGYFLFKRLSPYVTEKI